MNLYLIKARKYVLISCLALLVQLFLLKIMSALQSKVII